MAGVALGALAGAVLNGLAVDAGTAARAALDKLVGARYTYAQERRYAVYRARFAKLPALVDGRPQAEPWVHPGSYTWGSNDSEVTLTRERRSLAHTIERSLCQHRDDEAHWPIASPEAYLLSALLRWCFENIDRTQPSDHLAEALTEMQAWVSGVISDLRRELERTILPGSQVASAVPRLCAVRTAFSTFLSQADVKLPRIRVSQQRERLRGELDQVLVALATSLFYACNGCAARAHASRSELLNETEVANPWLALLGPLLRQALRSDDAREDWASALGAADALGAENETLCSHLCSIFDLPTGAKGVLTAAGAIGALAVAIVELGERARNFERVCDEPSRQISDRLRAACFELRAAHVATSS
mmetsp:Transcript_12614/g.31947  ORF Transcript_12614/g.31947 Transcript_12614/m.31947 type:complete len:363 (+) Transcript_12614:64-1152(+)